MQRCAALVCLAASAMGAGLAQDKVAPKEPPQSALLTKGQLQQVRAPLEQIFQFTFEGQALRLDRKQWASGVKDPPQPVRVAVGQSPLETLFRQIQKLAGGGGSSMSVGAGNRTITFSGQNLSGRLEIRTDAVRISLEEVQAPHRTLEFHDDGAGGLRLQVTHPDGDLVLLQQSRKGIVSAVALTSGHLFAGQADSFAAFLRQHRQAFETQFLPVFDHLGIQPVLPQHTPKVRQAVLAQLLRTPETLAEGRKLLANLDSETFAVREQATRTLHERFEVYKDLIQERLADKGMSLEVRTRLEKIVADHTDSVRVSQTVAALDLTRDARYLVSLLDHVRSEETPVLIRHLENTTGKKLGPDPAAWKAWANKERK